MKSFGITVFFLFISLFCFGQVRSGDYMLKLNFYPSFLDPSEIVIKAERDSAFLGLLVYKYRTKELVNRKELIIPSGRLISLKEFFKTYKFKIKNNIDAVGTHNEFIHGDSVLAYDIEMGTDGITVSGSFEQNNSNNKLEFWSPKKETQNAKLMVLLFDLLDITFTDKKSIDYAEQLQQYFPHRLGLKKLSDKPLTYKLYGDISSDDEEELYTFLQKLPKRKRVIIDMSNFSGMAGMFYDAFEEYCAKNKNIYWLNPSDYGLLQLYKSGIPNKQLLSKKKVAKIIKKGNGEVAVYKYYK
jgi:hypothetical protein